MSTVARVTCPGCRHTLRVPVEWLGQALKCKHCGIFIKATDRTGTKMKVVGQAAQPAVKRREKPAAAPAPRNGPPPQQPASQPPSENLPILSAGDFLNLQDEALQSLAHSRPAPKKKSRRGMFLLIGLSGVLLFFLAGLTAAGIILAPKLKQWAGRSGSQAANGAGSGTESSSSTTVPVKHTNISGEFPNRRALVISVNNYVYFNPTLYGATSGKSSRNVSSLMDRFKSGLRIPREQMAQISDAAPLNPVKPSKQVIEDSVKQYLKDVRPQDCVLVMFAGHVVPLAPADGQDEEPFLVPLDGIPDHPETMVPLKGILQLLEQCPARQKVLMLDVCRLNPARGLEFPGSGSPDAEVPGAMWDKLDDLLAKPAGNVQVWVSCLKNQFSYELELDFNDSVFLNAVDEALAKNVQDRLQYPEEPMPLRELVDKVNEIMKETLQKYTGSKENRSQVSRLSGSYRNDEASYDPTAPVPPMLKVAQIAPRGGAARTEDLRRVLAELQVPPIRSSGKVPPLRAESLPFISALDMKEYLDSAEKTPESYKKVLQQARATLTKLPVLSEELMSQGTKTDKQFDAEIQNRQKAIARQITELTNVVAALDEEDKANRETASKHWRAMFDYLKARVLAQLAYHYEVTSALGGARRKETPPLDQGYSGWRMAAVKKLQGTKEGKDADKARKKLLGKMEEEYKGTPYEVVARREESMALGVEWQPTQLK